MLPRSVLFANKTINERKIKKRGGRKDGRRRGGGESFLKHEGLQKAQPDSDLREETYTEY